MHPKDYKNKRVVCITKPCVFTLVKGRVLKGEKITVTDEFNNTHNWDDCIPLLEMLKAIAAPSDYQNIIDQYGQDFAETIWREFEAHYPVETAIAVVQLYCTSWQEFCCVTEKYGVSKERSPVLNQQFRDLIKAKGLDGLISGWFARREEMSA